VSDIVHFDFGMAPKDRARLRVSGSDAAKQEVETRADGSPAFPRPHDILREMVPASLRPEDFPACIGDYAGLMSLATGQDVSGYLLALTVAVAGATDDGLCLELDAVTGHRTPARLWGLIAGPSGAGKTPMLKAACEPLHSAHLRREHPDFKPVATDITTEKLRDVLIGQPRGILFVTDEFEAWLGQHDAYKKGAGGGGDRAMWLQLFEGGPQYIDRVGTGAKFIPNWGASLLSAATLVGLSQLARRLPADGLLQRFLSVVIRRPGARVHVDMDALEATRRVFYHRVTALAGMPPMATPLAVRMTAEAAAAFRSFDDRRALMIDAAEALSEGFAAHCGKLSELVGRLAMTFHAASIPGLVTAASLVAEPLSVDTMLRAIRAAEGFRRHALALHTELKGGTPALELARGIARSLLAKGLRTSVRRTDIAHECAAYRDAPLHERRDAHEILELSGWMRPQLIGDGRGRPYAGEPSSYDLNPEIFDRFASHGEQHRARREEVRRMIQQS
jgi:hypothetical protein